MITNNKIREFLGIEKSPTEIEIRYVDSLSVSENALMFINKSGIDELELLRLSRSKECVFLVSEEYKDFKSESCDVITVKNPKYLFCLIVNEFQLPSFLQKMYSSTCYNDFRQSFLEHKESLFCSECIIGSNCQIDPGVIIGGTDFSPVLGDTPGELIQFPQMGGVLIGDNVVIKYNTMIGKGTFGFTRIGSNTMIDFGCQIGHNCAIGDSCIIAAGTIIGGSTTVGDNTVIGIGAKIRNGIKIGENVSIGMGSVVIKDIPDNAVVVGNPARIIEHKKIFDEGGLI